MKKQYEFIEVDALKSVYEINAIQGRINMIYHYFLKSDEKVIYITDNGLIVGLISIGDMYRYYRNEEKTLPINQKFSYVEDAADFTKAAEFFQRVETIHEIPVVKNKVLLGVIRKKYYKIVIPMDNLNSALESERMNSWRKEKFRQFNQVVDMNVLYYNLSPRINEFTQEEQKILEKRRAAANTLECFEGMTPVEQKSFIGKHYSEKYMEQFSADYKQLRLYQKNGVYRYGDCCNATYHIENGYRQTPNVPIGAQRKIWMFGLCTVFGHYVRDDETVAYYLQSYLLEKGYSNYEVINAGTTANEYGRWWVEAMSPDDIVIIVNRFIPMYNRWGEEKEEAVKKVLGARYKGDLSGLCMQLEHPTECMIDSIPHCNYQMNEKIAQKMFTDLLPSLSKIDKDTAQRSALQDHFIPWDVIAYYEEYMEKYRLHKKTDKKTGAIVMNCNPFTLGHRYLIEEACKKVDVLYVFVVEEDKSYFSFEDRLEMVRRGVKDLEKVYVFPSGKYIISQETFAQYFEKDQIITQVDDMDYDVHIFGEVIADMLGITYRFVGEEPFDLVTKKYNETMKIILPQHGVKLIEIPRKEKDGVCISASKVRRYLENGQEEKAYAFVPESTRQYIKSKS